MDYADGNLGIEMKGKVEHFIKENSQYATLLREYDSSVKLTNETEISFPNKRFLYSDFMKIKQSNILLIRKNKNLRRSIVVITSLAAIFILVLMVIKPQNNILKKQEIVKYVCIPQEKEVVYIIDTVFIDNVPKINILNSQNEDDFQSNEKIFLISCAIMLTSFVYFQNMENYIT